MTASAAPKREQLAEQIARSIERNELQAAMRLCQELNQRYPDHAYGWYLASFLMKKARNYRDALKAIERALALAPCEKYRLHQARCLFDAGQIAQARGAAEQLAGASFEDPRLHNEAGALLHQLGDYPRSLQHYSRALERDPDNAEFHYNRAAVQRYLGDSSGAEAGFDRAIALRPEEYEAYNARAQLRTQSAGHNHVAQLQAVIARTSAPTGLSQLHYALAKELEDLGRFEESFASLQRGAGIKRQHMQYRVETDLEIMEAIRTVYHGALFDGHIEGCPGADPIFIIGMPRTGTTLVERILGSHTQVFAAGELNNFALELMRLHRSGGGDAPASRLDFVAQTAALDFRALGAAYLEATRPLRDERPHFIDKLPFNFLYAGLIHLALPDAKIIHLRRNPLDTCYAVYKQLFKDAYPFSYDLGELGRYFIAYDALMKHWHRVMPGVILELDYEAVVADIETQTRRLLAHCGLPWQEQCLQFHHNPQASTTASATQVRQPVYASSVGKWRHYEQQLQPLREQLQRAGIETGASAMRPPHQGNTR